MDLAAHLLDLETQLHRQDVRADEAALRQLIAEDFFEFGVSGTVWTRDAVVEALHHREAGLDPNGRAVAANHLIFGAADLEPFQHRHRLVDQLRQWKAG